MMVKTDYFSSYRIDGAKLTQISNISYNLNETAVIPSGCTQ
jgi:hypothetical protein